MPSESLVRKKSEMTVPFGFDIFTLSNTSEVDAALYSTQPVMESSSPIEYTKLSSIVRIGCEMCVAYTSEIPKSATAAIDSRS